ncbi:MAG: hypothetical protein MZU84_09505 [Sphingobacterium sp.]|nr:hypothetical protein [Sphingobacterium sp.]
MLRKATQPVHAGGFHPRVRVLYDREDRGREDGRSRAQSQDRPPRHGVRGVGHRFPASVAWTEAAITGKAVVSVRSRSPRPVLPSKLRADGSVYEIVDRDGRIASGLRGPEQGEIEWTILVPGRTVQSVSIPLSEVVLIEYRKTDATRLVWPLRPWSRWRF